MRWGMGRVEVGESKDSMVEVWGMGWGWSCSVLLVEVGVR